MKNYNIILIGSGTGKRILDRIIRQNPEIRIAVIDKDVPGGICLTRGCVPSKRLVYPAELVRTIEHAKTIGIEASIDNIDFKKIMTTMQQERQAAINKTRRYFAETPQIDFYNTVAKFVEPYVLELEDSEETKLKGTKILLCTGSEPVIPPIKGLKAVDFHTSKTLFLIDKLPKSLVIVGAGYIAAEMGHFFSTMGTKVTIIGRNPQFIKQEDQEISKLAKTIFSRYMDVYTNYEVEEVHQKEQHKLVMAKHMDDNSLLEVKAQEILLAAGRRSLSYLLQPEKSGVKTDEHGWIQTDVYLETTQKNIYALGDAVGKYLLKHKAIYEAEVIYNNAILGKQEQVDYDFMPHAIFSYPEMASVGLTQQQAENTYAKKDVISQKTRYDETVKGHSMELQNYFLKLIVHLPTHKVIGAHIIGPYASILIQELINHLYTHKNTNKAANNFLPILQGRYIHPSLSKLVEKAFIQLDDTLNRGR